MSFFISNKQEGKIHFLILIKKILIFSIKSEIKIAFINTIILGESFMPFKQIMLPFQKWMCAPFFLFKNQRYYLNKMLKGEHFKMYMINYELFIFFKYFIAPFFG